MTKVSRLPVEKEKMSLFLDDFWAAVASLKSKAEAKNFFNQFLTHTERKMFAKRFQISMMLLLGYEYREIKNRVKVSDATTARISNWLEDNGEAIISVSKRIIQLKEKKTLTFEVGRRRRGKETFGSVLLKEGIREVVKIVKDKSKESSLTK